MKSFILNHKVIAVADKAGSKVFGMDSEPNVRVIEPKLEEIRFYGRATLLALREAINYALGEETNA